MTLTLGGDSDVVNAVAWAQPMISPALTILSWKCFFFLAADEPLQNPVHYLDKKAASSETNTWLNVFQNWSWWLIFIILALGSWGSKMDESLMPNWDSVLKNQNSVSLSNLTSWQNFKVFVFQRNTLSHSRNSNLVHLRTLWSLWVLNWKGYRGDVVGHEVYLEEEMLLGINPEPHMCQ